MKIIADTHTHTIISGDAFCTLYDNVQMAKKMGMKYICVTEHVYTAVPNAPHPSYFKSMHALPRVWDDVGIVRGVEANVIDYNGAVDMPADILDWLDWVVASMHITALAPVGVKEHTSAWIGVAENPSIDVIGHSDDNRFPFDVDSVVRAFARYDKIVEVNEQSPIIRPGSEEMCKQILKCCMKYSVPVVVSSDAHFVDKIGVFDRSLALLDELRFPQDLVLNADEKRFSQLLAKKCSQAAPKTLQ